MLTPALAAISRVEAPSKPRAAKTSSAADEDARLGRSGRLARLVERRLVHDVRVLRAIDHAASSFARSVDLGLARRAGSSSACAPRATARDSGAPCPRRSSDSCWVVRSTSACGSPVRSGVDDGQHVDDVARAAALADDEAGDDGRIGAQADAGDAGVGAGRQSEEVDEHAQPAGRVLVEGSTSSCFSRSARSTWAAAWCLRTRRVPARARKRVQPAVDERVPRSDGAPW